MMLKIDCSRHGGKKDFMIFLRNGQGVIPNKNVDLVGNFRHFPKRLLRIQ